MDSLNRLKDKIEQLKYERNDIAKMVMVERADLAAVEAELNRLQGEAQIRKGRLSEKERALEHYEMTIRETEIAYSKLIDNSARLLEALDQESTHLKSFFRN